MAVPRVGVRYTWNGLTFSAIVPNYYGTMTIEQGAAEATGTENVVGRSLGMNVQVPGTDAPPAAGSFSTVRDAIASGTIVRAIVRYSTPDGVKSARILCPSDKVNELAQLPGQPFSFSEYKRSATTGTVSLVPKSGVIRTAKVLARTKVVY